MPISSLLLSLTLVLPLSGAKEQGLVALTPGKTLESSVEDGDEAITTEKLAGGYVDQPVLGKSFTLTVKTAGTWRLDLVGHAFDGYLVLRDAQGALVAEDDDGLVGVHARIVAELAAGQPYVVQAGALHGGRGTFELVAREGAPDPRESVPWSEREIEARIRTVFEQEKWKKVDVVQSKRYLVLTDSGAGKKFGKILDKDIYEGFFDLYGCSRRAC